MLGFLAENVPTSRPELGTWALAVQVAVSTIYKAIGKKDQHEQRFIQGVFWKAGLLLCIEIRSTDCSSSAVNSLRIKEAVLHPTPYTLRHDKYIKENAHYKYQPFAGLVCRPSPRCLACETSMLRHQYPGKEDGHPGTHQRYLAHHAQQFFFQYKFPLFILLTGLVCFVILPAHRLLALPAVNITDNMPSGGHATLHRFRRGNVDDIAEEVCFAMLAAEILDNGEDTWLVSVGNMS